MNSQHSEDLIILDYYLKNPTPYSPKILDIGANDGITYSNSRLFIDEYGWDGVLIEPTSKCVNKLKNLYSDNKNVTILEAGLYRDDGLGTIFLGNFGDRDTCVNQVSTLFENEKQYWEGRGVQYEHEEIKLISCQTLLHILENIYPSCSFENLFDIISIDIEGNDFEIYKILNDYFTPKFIIFEHNSNPTTQNNIKNLLLDRYELIWENPVNYIFKHKTLWENEKY